VIFIRPVADVIMSTFIYYHVVKFVMVRAVIRKHYSLVMMVCLDMLYMLVSLCVLCVSGV